MTTLTKDVQGNSVDKYRKIGSSLFKYMKSKDAYVCCFTSAGKTKAQLIAAYQRDC